MAETTLVKITKNTLSADEPNGWAAFDRANLNVVPDPMVLRTGELFLMGRSGVPKMGLDPDEVWNSIDENLGALFAFFDLLMTREKIPLIEYWHTFDTQLPELLGNLTQPVVVDYGIYDKVREEVVKNLKDRQVMALDAKLVEEVNDELTAYAWQWHPDVDLPNADEATLNATRFIVGGLIFSSYAAATGADHILQPKRSRLMLEASAPKDKRGLRGWEKEKELFSAFKEHCAPVEDIRVEDLTGVPSVLALVLHENSDLSGTPDILKKILKERDSDSGTRYRKWFQELRGAWAHGKRPEGEDDARDVLAELRRRSGVHADATDGLRADITLKANETGIGAEVKFQNVAIRIPPWLRGWFVSYLPFKPHRRFLLRLSLAQAWYEDITLDLKRVWDKT